MNRQRWKSRHPGNMQEALRACLDYALHKHNRSVAGVGELVGVSEWVLYKWMSDASIPSKRIRPLEHACGATYITQYLATSAGKLVIDIPAGQPVNEIGLLDLQNALNDAVRLLTRFYRGNAESADVLRGVTVAMVGLAGHRENVVKHQAPELALFEGEGE